MTTTEERRNERSDEPTQKATPGPAPEQAPVPEHVPEHVPAPVPEHVAPQPVPQAMPMYSELAKLALEGAGHAGQPRDQPAHTSLVEESPTRPFVRRAARRGAPRPAVPDPPARDTPAGDDPAHDDRPAPLSPLTVSIPRPRSHQETPGQRRPPTAESLTAEAVLRTPRQKPARGWRRLAYVVTAGLVNPRPPEAEQRLQDLVRRARSAIGQRHTVAVMSLKGGVGKTTTTIALGSMFATLRGDRVIAVDANPDRGTLGERLPRETTATVRDLVNAHEHQEIHSYTDVRTYTSQAESRLEALVSDIDPNMSLALTEADYRTCLNLLDQYYNLIISDCGAGLLHDVMRGVLGLAGSLVVVSTPNLDGARSTSATLDWLEAHGYNGLVRRSVAVISCVRRDTGAIDLDRLEEHFAARCSSVVKIPYDPHLESGATVDLNRLQPATHEAFLELAAAVAGGFAKRHAQLLS